MSSEVILEAKGICKSFSGVQVLKSVNFDVRKGQTSRDQQLRRLPGTGNGLYLSGAFCDPVSDCSTECFPGT